MSALVIDCPTGLAGDMLLSAFLDLGVPESVVHEPMQSLGLGNAYLFKVEQSDSGGLRGIRLTVSNQEQNPPHRRWVDLRKLISEASLSSSLKANVLNVFCTLAEAEATVHGCSPDQVHFHEIGAIDSLVDVIGVCAAVESLSPGKIYCNAPAVGHGLVKTAHGVLPVPVPAVLELAKRHQVPIRTGEDLPAVELTTPTGIALMAVLANQFHRPSTMEVEGIGVGLGHRLLDRPNLLRLIRIHEASKVEAGWQELVIQEAWIDDATAEELASLAEQLRRAGALDVVHGAVLMKKQRPGTAVIALTTPQQAAALRHVWWRHSPTIGLREREQGRWVLPRRSGTSSTPWGLVRAKQTRRPDGTFTLKWEQDELQRLSSESGLTVAELRERLFLEAHSFVPEEDWRC
ncbi:MAG: TIGR00299 family protein [Synechococcus sp. NP17]|nr:TIGR00299 family protein [Synechococcus sp. NP17]|tara:strand:- start:782 stop:1993 length:1212 start_codon:yes stop_codon:yes gene_type:complete